MKNRIIKIINILLIISFMFTPLISYAEPVETEETPEAEKGVLRCPPTISDPNVKCSVVDGGNAVEITYGSLKNAGDVQIIKRVAKTDTIGRYSVSFTLKGKEIKQQQVASDAYIVIVLDMSKTIVGNVGQMKIAVTNFTNTILKKVPDAKFALVQFATKSVVKRGFNNTTITDICDCSNSKNCNSKCMGIQLKTTSQVGYALAQANNLLLNNSIPNNANKYIVLFGDGRYWYDIDTFWKSTQSGNYDRNYDIRYSGNNYVDYQLDVIAKNNIKTYGIRYNGSARGNSYNNNNTKINKNSNFYGTYSNYGQADDAHMKYIANGNYFPANSADEYTARFIEVAKKILSDPALNVTTVSSELSDEIGGNFSITDANGNSIITDNIKKFNIGNIPESGVSLEPFYININPASKTDWHKTNESFHLTYTLSDGTEKKINCDDNPEVYWVQEKEDIDSCSGEIKSPKITKTITNSYYSIHCEEGYTENGKKYENFTTAMKVNSLDDGVEEFTLPSGAGFTAEVSLKTNIRCTYKFDASRYNSEYATLEREIAQLEKEIESLKTSSNSQILESGDIAWCKYIDSSGDLLTPPITLGQVSDTSSIKPIELALYGKKAGDVFEVTMHDSLNDTDVIYTVTVVSIVKKVDILDKELYEKTLNFNSLTSIADDYLNTSSEMALDEYKDRFFNLSPGLGVSYKDEKGKVVVNLYSNIVDKEPKGDEKFNNKDEDPVCQGTEDTIKIGNKTVKVFNQTCTGNFWRIMNIEKICLNMKTGQTEKCSDTDTIKQLDGLNKHYTPLKLDEDTKKMMKLDGDIVITLEKAGYDESINVTLKNCTVKGQTSDAYYREIDVTDPFLQKATHGQRAIGSNFKGEYDFVKIISPTIWNSNNPLYTFNLSKADVATIENDTTNLGKISYLGDDCYISNRKYVCTLPHQYKK